MKSRSEWPKLSGFIAGSLIILLIGCATTSPFSDMIRSRIDPGLTPARVLTDYPKTEGREVLWGGIILESRNLVDSTELAVLAYPIDSAGMPQTEDDVSFGRFIVLQKGYLETVTYAPGREITVYGRVVGTREVALGTSRHRVPVVAAMQIHLWHPAQPWAGPVFHFGIGVSGGF